jgi:hypothetical protein
MREGFTNIVLDSLDLHSRHSHRQGIEVGGFVVERTDHLCTRDSRPGAGGLVCRTGHDRRVLGGELVVHIRPLVVLELVVEFSVRSRGHSLRIGVLGSVRAGSLGGSSLGEEGLDDRRGRPFRGGRSDAAVYEIDILRLAGGVLPGSEIVCDQSGAMEGM